MSSATHHHEVVVLGGQLPGVVTAALLAERGVRVLLLRDRAVPATYELDEQPCLRRPFFVPGPDAFPALTRVLSELKLHHEFVRAITEPEQAYQVLLPEHRVDVWRDRARLDAELTREFGVDAVQPVGPALQALEAALNEIDEFFDGSTPLPPGTWRERRAFKRRRKDFPQVSTEVDPLVGVGAGPLRLVLLAPTLLAGRRSDGGTGHDLALRRTMRLQVRGLFTLPGGEDEFVELLLERFRSKGGEVREGSVDALERKWSRLLAVRCPGDHQFGFDFLVCAADPARLADLLGGDRLGRKILRCAGEAEPAGWLGCVNLVVRAAGLPRPLADRAFVIEDPHAPLQGDNLLYVNVAPRTAPHEVPPPVRVLRVCGVFPTADRPATAADLARRVRAGLKTVFPFLDEHVEAEDVARQGAGEDDAFLTPWTDPVVDLTTTTTLPIRGPAKNLVFAHRASLPGLGLEGELLAGYRAAQIVLANRKPRKV